MILEVKFYELDPYYNTDGVLSYPVKFEVTSSDADLSPAVFVFLADVGLFGSPYQKDVYHHVAILNDMDVLPEDAADTSTIVDNHDGAPYDLRMPNYGGKIIPFYRTALMEIDMMTEEDKYDLKDTIFRDITSLEHAWLRRNDPTKYQLVETFTPPSL